MPNALYTDTIVAIATAAGIGGIGIVRISGENALDIARSLSKLTVIQPRYVHFSKIHSPSGELLDEGCIIFFKSPESYTGEDVIEIQLHGSPYILQSLLNYCLTLGARLATEGEFTKRAFINGKLSLRQAESINDIIHASSEKSHAVALNHLKGKLFNEISEYRSQLVELLENIEASIDFPDEVERIDRKHFLKVLTQLQKKIRLIVDNKDYGEYVAHGVHCIIVGKPNVGKSSLFNQLLGNNRAIVTDIAGTTRDYIQGSIELGGVLFHFYDTAGIRESDDYIEYLGIQKIQELIEKAQLILWVNDRSQPFTQQDEQVWSRIKHKKNISILLNKSDCESQAFQWPENYSTYPIFNVSAKKSDTLATFKKYLRDTFISTFENKNLDLLCNARQIQVFMSCDSFLSQLEEDLLKGQLDDMLSVPLRAVITLLGEVTGDDLNEEILDGIFQRFCIGK